MISQAGAIITLGLFCAFSGAAVAATYYDKLGISDRDIIAYKQTSIPACRTAMHENKDPMKPPGNVAVLRHFVRLYAQCQRGLENQNAPIGVLRVNNLWFGMTCIALGAIDVDNPIMPECNMKSYLPKN